MKKLRAVEKITRTTLLPGGPAERPRPAAKPAAKARKPGEPASPARAERARNRRPRRTQRAA